MAPTPSRAADPAPTGSALTVNGQTDVAYVDVGGTHTFQVGDLLDMASLVPDFIEASNPDPEFWNFNGWWTTNTFFLYASDDCSGQWIDQFYTSSMLPSHGSATASITGAVRTYSVQAEQWLWIRWLERRIDVVDSVDEATTVPAQAKSACVTVRMVAPHISLLANGSTAAITIGETDPIGLATDQPTGDGWRQQLLETDSHCVDGEVIAEGAPGGTVGTTIARPTGTHWFMVRAVRGTDEIYTNCVRVTVEATPATLRVDGAPDSLWFLTGQALTFYADGFWPGAKVVGIGYLGQSGCDGPGYIVMSGTANDVGAYETTIPIHATSMLGMRFAELDVDGSVIEATNCVTMFHQSTDVRLLVNGSTGPVLVDGGEIHLTATGLTPGAVAHAVIGCSGPFEPDDFGQVVDEYGEFEAYLSDDLPNEFAVRVALAPPSEVSSNCVWVRLVTYLIDPVIEVNGALDPPPVDTGTPIEITGTEFPPDRTVTVRTFPGSSACEGDSTVQPAFTDEEGNLVAVLVAGPAGPVSFQIETEGWTSNCVGMTVTTPPTPEPEQPVIPTGPITLRANGHTSPQVVPAGTSVEFTAEGLGAAETFTLRRYAAADCSGNASPMGSGPGAAELVGAMTKHTAAVVGFRLSAGERISNCVTVTWQAPPQPEPDPLVVVVPGAITRPNDPGQPGAVVTWPAVTSTGGVAPVTIGCTHQSGATFPIGSTTVECTATDSASTPALLTHAVASTSFTVTVVDVEPPTIDAIVAVVTPAAGGGSAVVTYTPPAASDNSGVSPTVSCSPESGSTFTAGTHDVTCTAADVAGNTASSTYTVTVSSAPSSSVPTTSVPLTSPTGAAVPTTSPGLPGLAPELPATGAPVTMVVALAAATTVLGLALVGRARRRA